MKRWYSLPILARYLIGYMLVFAILICLLLPIRRAVYSTVYDSVAQNARSHLQNGMERIQNMLSNLYAEAYTIASSEEYKRLSSVKRRGAVVDTIDLLDGKEMLMSHVILSNEIVRGVYVLFTNNDLFLSNFAISLHADEFYSRIPLRAGQDAHSWRADTFGAEALSLGAEAPLNAQYFANTPTGLFFRVGIFNDMGALSGAVTYVLDGDGLSKLLADDEILGYGALSLAGDGGGVLQTRGSPMGLAGGEPQELFTADAEQFALRATIAVPYEVILLKTMEITRLFHIYFYIGIIGAVVMMACIILHQTIPVWRLMSIARQHAQPGAPRNPYGYIGETIRAISSSRDHLEQQLQFARGAQRNTLLANACCQGLYSQSEREQLNQMLSAVIGAYRLVRLYDANADSQLPMLAEARFAELAPFRTIACYLSYNNVLMLISDGNDINALDAAFAQIARELPEGALTIGASAEHSGLDELSAAYREANLALEADSGGAMMLYGRDVHAREAERFDVRALIKLKELTRAGEREEVERLFEALKADGAGAETQGQMQRFFAVRMALMEALPDAVVKLPEWRAELPASELFGALKERALAICAEQAARSQTRKLDGGDRVTRYIAEHYSDPALSAETIAARLGISKKAVNDAVRCRTGLSTAVYIEAARIDHVEKYLLETDCTMEEIMARTGYVSLNSLYRAFARRHGMPPGKWREAHQSDKRGSN